MQNFKINNLSNWMTGIILSFCLLATACTSDQLPEPPETDCSSLTPTYSNNIQPIIEKSCAFSGCHLDSAPGVFDTYNGLLAVLEDNTFRQRVISDRFDEIIGMPPDNAPAGRDKDLTEAEILLIDCWLEAGFPE